MIPTAAVKTLRNSVAGIFVLLVTITSCYSQAQGNIWYFARTLGLDFNTAPPSVLVDGQIDYDIGGTEGSASIASNDGKLLFYANGEKVWNRKHQIMKNGDGLMGHHSSTNGAVIVPLPGENSKYYVFNTHAFQERLANGLRYSMVDMCGDNGYGEVIPSSKNTLLLEEAGEKLAVTRHINGTDYWLISHVHFSNAFYVYLITENGISGPIISEIGTIHGNRNAPDDTGYQDAIGQMKISPNGHKVALVMENRAPDVIDLFDFDNSTGRLSNFVDLSDGSHSQGIYGVSFSPNNLNLYVSGRAGIFQFRLNAGSGSRLDIIQSKYKIANQRTAGGLQLGPDGKIYVSRFDYAGVIENPDLPGAACNFKDNAIYFEGNINTYAFPTFLDNFDYPDKGSIPLEVNIIDSYSLCSDEMVRLDATSTGEDVKYLWPDGSSQAFYYVNLPGNYSVKIQDRFCTVEKTITVSSPPSNTLGPDKKACEGDTVVLSGNAAGTSYSWSNGSTDSSVPVYSSGTYWVDVTRDHCTKRDSIQVTFLEEPNFSFGNDTTLCEGQSLRLHITVPADDYKWQDGTKTGDYTVTVPGNYWATARVGNCQFTDEINIMYAILPPLSLGTDTVLCKGNPLQLNVNTGNTSVLWSNGSLESSISVSESGHYWAELSAANCSTRDSLYVQYVNCNLTMPNIFTPNGDSFNSNFRPMEMDGVLFGQLVIYNRWGLEIYQTTDLYTGWDGSEENISSGVYFWELKYTDITKRTNKLKGTVSLVK